MASFYNAETSEPVSVLYISSSRNGNVVLTGAALSGLSMRLPEVVVAKGGGTAKADPAMNPKVGEYRWTFTGLSDGSLIVARDGSGNVLAQLPVARLDSLPSYRTISQRLRRRGMNIDLDCHIDYVCYASKIVGEGIAFRPKSAAAFKAAITSAQLFHHDDRSDPFGRMAAAATIGEGYREVSTPSLHVAISQALSSVHIDSYVFLFRAPDGDVVIGPDVGQHIFDELLFRMPMPWLRRRGLPFVASVLQALHPVLPNITNRYSPIVGLRVELGGTPNRDLRSGVPRLSFEGTYNVGLSTDRRVNYGATLRLLTGGNPDRTPDWTLSLKTQSSCRDLLCHDHQESVMLYLTASK